MSSCVSSRPAPVAASWRWPCRQWMATFCFLRWWSQSSPESYSALLLQLPSRVPILPKGSRRALRPRAPPSAGAGFGERVLTMDLSLTDSRYPTPRQKLEFFSQVLRRVESLPGVRSAAFADSLPLSPYQGFLMMSPNRLLPKAALSRSTSVMMRMLTVSPGYFYTLGIPVLKGRTFTDHDDAQAPKVA